MNDAATISLSLVSHTNVGKTTLARTLLARDVGEVRDEAHVTQEAESQLLIASPQGDRLLLCSDGLWGTVADAEIVDQLSRNAISDAVPELVEQALRNGGPKCDNVSVLAVEWEAAEDHDSEIGISTQSLGEEVFASTIQASVLGTDSPDELDDAEIERSIREINEAIRRSSQQKKG